ncbi:MAG: hypothetical protein J6T10_21065 [Methanobrevibacter sp.]|nr:hypothetical protein [Methanobrevibacter sp.]
MESRLDYIFTPSTLISVVSAIVACAVAWTSQKTRLDNVEKDMKELQGYELHIKIAEMQKDIQYMREMFDKFLENKR